MGLVEVLPSSLRFCAFLWGNVVVGVEIFHTYGITGTGMRYPHSHTQASRGPAKGTPQGG